MNCRNGANVDGQASTWQFGVNESKVFIPNFHWKLSSTTPPFLFPLHILGPKQLPPMPRRVPFPMLRRIRAISRRVVSRRTIQHLKLHRRDPLPVRTLRRPRRLITVLYALRPSCNILVRNRAFEDLQRCQGLVERDFVPSVVDAGEAEGAGLTDLAVHDFVAGTDVDIAGAGEAGGVDLVGNNFAAEPIAVVVGVAGIHHNRNILLQELAHVLDGAGFPPIVPRSPESRADGTGRLGEVLVGTNSGLNFWGVEVLDVEQVREWIGLELADVVLVAIEHDVVDGFDLVRAELITGAAYFVNTGGFAVVELVDAVARAVEIIVQLRFGGGVVGRVVVGVARVYGVIVVGLVLDYGVVPSVTDQDGVETDFVGTRGVLGVLGFDVLVEDWAVVTAVTLGGEIIRFSRVLRECAHEALESPIEVWSCCVCRVGCKGFVGLRVGSACASISSVIRAIVVW